MATIRFEEQIEIPMEIGSLAEFRAWATSTNFPEHGRVDYLGGCIEVDMSPEDLHTHGKLKVELIRALGQRIKDDELGELYSDRARVSCPEADLSVEPDLVFVSDASLNQGHIRLIPKTTGAPDRFIEIEGPPDLIVEIVSDSSVAKDTQRLPERYFQAGVREFWLVDSRAEELRFRIFNRGPSTYLPVTIDADGYQPSSVFHYLYRLSRHRNRHNRLVFDLAEREWA